MTTLAQIESEWRDTLTKFMHTYPAYSTGAVRVTSDELFKVLGIPSDRPGQLLVAKIMKDLGYKRTTIRTGKDLVVTGYGK